MWIGVVQLEVFAALWEHRSDKAKNNHSKDYVVKQFAQQVRHVVGCDKAA